MKYDQVTNLNSNLNKDLKVRWQYWWSEAHRRPSTQTRWCLEDGHIESCSCSWSCSLSQSMVMVIFKFMVMVMVTMLVPPRWWEGVFHLTHKSWPLIIWRILLNKLEKTAIFHLSSDSRAKSSWCLTAGRVSSNLRWGFQKKYIFNILEIYILEVTQYWFSGNVDSVKFITKATIMYQLSK